MLTLLALLPGCDGDEPEQPFPATDSLPLPPGWEVPASRDAAGAAGPGRINYLVVTGPATASRRELAHELKAYLRAEGWMIGRLPSTRLHRGEIPARSGDVFAVFTKDP